MDLKKLKPVHWIYNLLHYRQLQHNKSAYKKYRIHKPLVASISSKDFPDKESKAWLDVHDSAIVAPQHHLFASFPSAVQEGIRSWSANGYMILENFFSKEDCDAMSADIDRLVRSGELAFTGANKLMFANKKSASIRKAANDPALKRIMGFLLDKELIAFQTINFIEGSQQRAHSDSVHMTTYPLGYLIAAWVALEDVNEQNGPLFYYPGSHKLPYLLNNDFNEGETAFTLGKKNYPHYEDMMQQWVEEKGYKPRSFLAKKGDVLIWHANLVHGGSPILNSKLTRKSLVVHYYASDVIKYHEITERPALV